MFFETDTATPQPCHQCYLTGLLLELVADEDVVVLRERDGRLEFHVTCSDTFGYACSDSEPISWDQVESVHTLFMHKTWWNVVAWIAQRRRQKPVIEICEDMEDAGISLPGGLADNPENANGRRWRAQRGSGTLIGKKG